MLTNETAAVNQRYHGARNIQEAIVRALPGAITWLLGADIPDLDPRGVRRAEGVDTAGVVEARQSAEQARRPGW
jgi:hypothetical protein